MALAHLTDIRNPVRAPGQPARPAQLKALTSVRFLAALHVALFHLVPGDAAKGLVPLLISVGYTGVSFFFVLSGFILTYSHAREWESGNGSAARFYFARFARIYPVYLLSMIVAGVLGRALFAQPRHILVYAVDLAMLQSWFIRMVGFFNGPGWTLSCEAIFYLLFPWLVLRLRPKTRWQGIASVAACWVVSLTAPLVCMLYTFGPHWSQWLGGWTTPTAFAMERIPLFQLPEFLAGIAIGWLLLRFGPGARTSGDQAGGGLVAAGLLYVLGVFLGSRHIPVILIHNGLLIPGYAALILGLSRENVFSRLLSFGPLMLLGEASYVFYLAHHMFHHWVMARFGVGEGLAAATVEIAALIPLSIAIHLAVERPARRALLQWWKARAALREQEPARFTAA